MWKEPFEAELRRVGAEAVDEQDRKVDRVTLSFEFDIDSELAGQLPGGAEALEHLEDGTWKRGPTFPRDTRRYALDVLGESGKPERTIKGVTVSKVELTRKELKEETRQLCKLALQWEWTSGEVEWALRQLRTTLSLRLSLMQTEMAEVA